MKRLMQGGVLVLALLALTVSDAHASRTPGGEVTVGGLMLAYGGITSGVMFAVVDVVYGVQGRLLPTGWAFAQLLAPAPLLLGAAISDGHSADTEVRVWCGVFSAWFFAHAIWSLVTNEHAPGPESAPPRTSSPRKASPTRPARFGLMPLPDGAALTLSGQL
jgi:hypothetical protein